MEIGSLVSDAIRYPSSDWKKVIILGILYVIAFLGSALSAYTFGISLILILAGIPIAGYLFRIIKSTFAGFDELPDFDEFGDMLIDGLKVVVVGIVYQIIPAIVIIIGVIGTLASVGFSASNIANPAAFIGLVSGVAIIGVILAIIFLIFEVIAIANMALYDGELGAAFRFGEILGRISKIGWGSYIIWLIVMFIILIVAGIIMGILSIIPIIGIFIAALIVYPYLYMFYARSLALLFASSEEEATQPASEPETAPPAE